jgi:hypothetical protein
LAFVDLHGDEVVAQDALAKKPLIFRVRVHPHARVVGAVVVVDLEGRVGGLDVRVPADAMEHRVSRIVREAGADDLPSELVEEPIDVRVRDVECRSLGRQPPYPLSRHRQPSH